MGKVCKRLKATKTTVKNQRVKRGYTQCLDPLAVLEDGCRKTLVPDSCTYIENNRGAIIGLTGIEDHVLFEARVISKPHALFSIARISNAASLLNHANKTPKTPCSKGSFHGSTYVQSTSVIRIPKTCCIPGRLCSSPSILSNLVSTPQTPCTKSRIQSSPSARRKLLRTPKTPGPREALSESRLESLPMDLLVNVLCHLHHDQLRPSFHVSKRVREAVLIAREYHFNFTTPDRSRQTLLSTTTPQPWEHWPFVKSKNSMLKPCPKTPKAPRHTSRPPPKFKDYTDVCPIDDALFQESPIPLRCTSSTSLRRSISKSQLASSRALFYSDELNSCNSLL